jgi:hypothetical protein
MARHKGKASIYDPVARSHRMFDVTIEAPDLVIDCLDREKSCLYLQELSRDISAARRYPLKSPAAIKPKRCINFLFFAESIELLRCGRVVGQRGRRPVKCRLSRSWPATRTADWRPPRRWPTHRDRLCRR